MKTGHCRKCDKQQACTKIKDCPLVKAEMKRIERGRHKHILNLVYMHDLPENDNNNMDKLIYG